MGRKITYVPIVKSASNSATVGLDLIPAEVKQELEDAYALMQKQPNGRISIDFDTEAEVAEYFSWALSYAKLRKEGALIVRKSPVRDCPPTQLNFTIKAIPPKDTATTAIHNGVAAVQAAVTEATLAPEVAQEVAAVLPAKKTTASRR